MSLVKKELLVQNIRNSEQKRTTLVKGKNLKLNIDDVDLKSFDFKNTLLSSIEFSFTGIIFLFKFCYVCKAVLCLDLNTRVKSTYSLKIVDILPLRVSGYKKSLALLTILAQFNIPSIPTLNKLAAKLFVGRGNWLRLHVVTGVWIGSLFLVVLSFCNIHLLLCLPKSATPRLCPCSAPWCCNRNLIFSSPSIT